ncbi:sporulation protein YunB [Clostridium sp. 19966]|uniref:sporulation protein YunB n=1 Tax=Clostridium sp. 19966 TaxID=2768166 RepID=UPI0028DECCF7|nr:sporulation protein YunB [Clostridium sp. 19966]MDT8717456.1 sporulation protein YunB [Clostridium sp. 19966]
MKKKKTLYKKLLIPIILIIVCVNILLYAVDRTITPVVMSIAESEMKAEALDIINKNILDIYSSNFDYNKIMSFERDSSGNIVMMQADTLKLNNIACNISIKCQKDLKEYGKVGIKVPLGYVFKNNIISNMGPAISVKMEPIGSIEVKYKSEFQGAGINQSIHRIYVQVKTSMRIIAPTDSSDIQVNNEVPLSETVIIGKVPNTSVNFDLERSGTTLPNK